MATRFALVWLPRFLLGVCLTLAAALFLLVLLAPLLDNGTVYLFAFFARDLTLRRTALASAIGLTATAFIFFQPRSPLP